MVLLAMPQLTSCALQGGVPPEVRARRLASEQLERDRARASEPSPLQHDADLPRHPGESGPTRRRTRTFSRLETPWRVRALGGGLGGSAEAEFGFTDVDVDFDAGFYGGSISYQVLEEIEIGVRYVHEDGDFDATINTVLGALSGRGDYKRDEYGLFSRFNFGEGRTRGFLDALIGGGELRIRNGRSPGFASFRVGLGVDHMFTRNLGLELGGSLGVASWGFELPGEDAVFSEGNARLYLGLTLAF